VNPKAVLRSEPHARGTTETMIVLSGSLRPVAGKSYDLATGDSGFFRADVEHSYENRGSRETRRLDVIHYARS
jgi:mannose-6-phosphate isomerase-like protein (cupin superfamily)